MVEVIAIGVPALFVVGIVWLIISSNKRINNALTLASEVLGFTPVLSKNIFRKKKIFGELRSLGYLVFNLPQIREMIGASG